MGEAVSAPNANLHDIAELQVVKVREDISLRPMRDDDAPRILEILERDPSIRQSVTVAARMQTEQDVHNEVVAMEEDPGLIRYAITNESDRCIGLVSFWLDPGFFGQEPLADTYGFGYFIDPTERGKGIVTGSVRQLMDVATTQIFSIKGFTAFCVDKNKGSVSVLATLGFNPTDNLYPEPIHGWLERQYVKDIGSE